MVKKARKHQFHCQKCGLGCEIYKKGKGHRVLVCPNCGILATNPFSIGKALLGAGKTIPGAGAILGALEGGFSGSSTPTTSREKPSHIITDSKDKPNYSERVINKVMHDERLN